MKTNLTAEERETIIGWTDADETISISTCQKKMITLLRKNPVFTETSFSDGVLMGTLPLGCITVRNAGKGQRTRRVNTAPRCGAIKANGEACQAIANSATGRCAKHS